MDKVVAFCKANGLTFSFHTLEDGAEIWTISNQRSIGLIDSGRIQGTGATIDEALKVYMTAALNERAVQKASLASYAADTLVADTDVIDAFTKDIAYPTPEPLPLPTPEPLPLPTPEPLPIPTPIAGG